MKKAQMTIFIIIAVVVVAIVIGFVMYSQGLFTSKLPASMQPIEETLLSCLEDYSLSGSDILETQGGYIELPTFESGSTYMPFSSQFEFMGNAIPYWYYVSGNNIQKEQVPSKSDMEGQLENFIEGKIKNCVFDSYYDQGFEIVLGETKANVDITDSNIKVDLNMDVKITKGEETGKVNKHSVKINSKLGSLYDSAKEIYDSEQKNLFLEDYAVDTLRLYAPVDGVEVTCSPKTWVTEEVFDELREGIEANTLSLKTKGDSDDYFVVDLNVDNDVRFLNSKNWPYSVEVVDEDNVLIANPIGNQPGLGILGFCYVPYHFVYNLKYPVLVQVYDDDEIFQFPMAVIIQGNNPRESLDANAVNIETSELCEHKNIPVTINVRDNNLNDVDADVTFECLGTKCNLGFTEGSTLTDTIPQCMNGYILASADGYKQGKYLYNKISSGTVNIVLDKVHELNVNLKLDGDNYNGNAIITFVSETDSRSVAYPEQTSVELSEGEYEVTVYIYEEGNLKLASSVQEQCVEVPRSGLLGIAGLTKKECFDIEIPEQIISDVLAGGGKQNDYFLDSQLSHSDIIEINAESIDVPETIEELQNSYVIFESRRLDINFK